MIRLRQIPTALARPILAGLALGLGVLAGSCAHDAAPLPVATSPATPPPPPDYMFSNKAIHGTGNGVVFRTAYFTAGEVADPRWEQGRIKMMGESSCPGDTGVLVRRDVRWYPASKESGEPCAAILYTTICSGKPGILDPAAEEVVTELLAMEPEKPFEASCGDKDGTHTNARPRKQPGVSQQLPSFRTAAAQRYRKPQLDPTERAACKARGGIATMRSMFGDEFCLHPARDAGKTCTDGSQCKTGACVANDLGDSFVPPRAGTRSSGICARTDRADACGWRIVNGRVQPPTCLDADRDKSR